MERADCRYIPTSPQDATASVRVELLDPDQFAGAGASVFARQRAAPVPAIRAADLHEISGQRDDLPAAYAQQTALDVLRGRNHMHVRAVRLDLTAGNGKVICVPEVEPSALLDVQSVQHHLV